MIKGSLFICAMAAIVYMVQVYSDMKDERDRAYQAERAHVENVISKNLKQAKERGIVK